MNNILEKSALWTGVIIALGMIISNTYLSNYGIVDFKIFQVKTFSTGLLFVIISLLHLLIFNFKFDMSKVEYYGYTQILHIITTRFSTIIFIYLFVFYDLNNLDKAAKMITYIAETFVVMFYLKEIIYAGATIAEKKRKINKIPINIINFGFNWIAPLVLIILVIIDNEVRKLVFEYKMIPILVLLISIFRKVHFLDDTKKTELDESEPYYFSLFQLNSKNNLNWKEISYSVILAFIMTFFFIRLYVSLYYIHIPENYGGSKPTQIELQLDNGEKIIGKKIHQNETKIFILQGETIRHIENSKIKMSVK